MEITQFTDELDGSIHIIIKHDDGSTTSMLKTYWDELQAKQDHPNTLS